MAASAAAAPRLPADAPAARPLGTAQRLVVDARGMRGDYLQAVEEFRDFYRIECPKANIDYVPMDTSVSFDKALMQYLLQRQKRF